MISIKIVGTKKCGFVLTCMINYNQSIYVTICFSHCQVAKVCFFPSLLPFNLIFTYTC